MNFPLNFLLTLYTDDLRNIERQSRASREWNRLSSEEKKSRSREAAIRQIEYRTDAQKEADKNRGSVPSSWWSNTLQFILAVMFCCALAGIFVVCVIVGDSGLGGLEQLVVGIIGGALVGFVLGVVGIIITSDYFTLVSIFAFIGLLIGICTNLFGYDDIEGPLSGGAVGALVGIIISTVIIIIEKPDL